VFPTLQIADDTVVDGNVVNVTAIDVTIVNSFSVPIVELSTAEVVLERAADVKSGIPYRILSYIKLGYNNSFKVLSILCRTLVTACIILLSPVPSSLLS
jgi:hypothetical protein